MGDAELILKVGVTKNHLALLAATVTTSGALLVLTTLAMVFGGVLETRYYPVMSEWKIQSAVYEGDHLVLTGTVIKRRACEFIPPTRARDSEGRNFSVVSGGRFPRGSWSADEEPQVWGPWRVHMDGHEREGRLTFYYEHKCHPLWTLFTEVGAVDLQTLKQAPGDRP